MLTHRAEFAAIILGTIFLFIGVGACCLAAVRRGNTRRVLFWFGVLSAMYGVRLYAEVPGTFSLIAGSFSRYAPQLEFALSVLGASAMVSKGAKSDRLASPLPTSQNPTVRLLSSSPVNFTAAAVGDACCSPSHIQFPTNQLQEGRQLNTRPA